MKYFIRYLKSQAPEKYHSHLIPTYRQLSGRMINFSVTELSWYIAIGCKRIIRDPEYLTSLHRPNVELEWEPIDQIARDGILLKNGKHIPLDVIVAATGFHTVSMHHLSAFAAR
jgi:cation diffusion facilitator CzcD-associated flavoprotein CzcO